MKYTEFLQKLFKKLTLIAVAILTLTLNPKKSYDGGD